METRKRKTRIRQNPEVKNIESGITFYQTQIDVYNNMINSMIKRRDEFQANIDRMKSDLSKLKHYETV
jgi:peptidoglycan hydrolase CwlO-like protein